jgi:hypothetical protein
MKQTILKLKLHEEDFIDLKYILRIVSERQLREAARMLGVSIGKYKDRTLDNVTAYLTDNEMTISITIPSNK